MAVRIGSNVLSQSIQRNLHRANLDLSAASERLSSGQRINKASDDPAGLALMASLRMDTRVFSQAIRNLNDGISATNIAESAMDSLGFITNRIQELATQSISGTVADGQRKSIQQEVTALQAEWNRIVQSTSFNGMRLLSGDNTRFVLQGGRDIEGTSIVQIGEDYNGTTGRVSVGTSGSEGNGSSGSVSISADGKIIGFTSNSSNLVAGDTNGIQDSFIRNLTTGTTTRISTSSSGVQANASSFYTDISANGRFASFTSTATNLDPSDVNGVQDVFFKDLTTGETRLLSVSSTGALGNGGATNGS